jgi:hypothetical protein
LRRGLVERIALENWRIGCDVGADIVVEDGKAVFRDDIGVSIGCASGDGVACGCVAARASVGRRGLAGDRATASCRERESASGDETDGLHGMEGMQPVFRRALPSIVAFLAHPSPFVPRAQAGERGIKRRRRVAM